MNSGGAPRPGMTFQSDVGRLRRVLLRHPRLALSSRERIDAQWEALGYLGRPDLDGACREADALAALLERLGAEVVWADTDPGGLDGLYVRDPSLVLDEGAILGRMGKEARAAEPEALRSVYEQLGIPIVGAIEPPGTLEGGDLVWLDDATLAVGRGYRTNAEGLAQLRALVEPRGIRCVPVHLPHFRGPDDVFHLMSILSPLGPRRALVHGPLLPVPFREELLARGMELLEVAPEEYDTQGGNVLAVAPDVVVAVDGNPRTRERMEAAGVEVHSLAGGELCVKGQGGPTCLTRPLEREG